MVERLGWNGRRLAGRRFESGHSRRNIMEDAHAGGITRNDIHVFTAVLHLGHGKSI